jgi:hypothetical protein
MEEASNEQLEARLKLLSAEVDGLRQEKLQLYTRAAT